MPPDESNLETVVTAFVATIVDLGRMMTLYLYERPLVQRHSEGGMTISFPANPEGEVGFMVWPDPSGDINFEAIGSEYSIYLITGSCDVRKRSRELKLLPEGVDTYDSTSKRPSGDFSPKFA
ncbi:hypothetical protein HGA91_05495 [candidate division WWE3 bacterium]|nr:hypothetical protein [candidate division WWE3 bacterium]